MPLLLPAVANGPCSSDLESTRAQQYAFRLPLELMNEIVQFLPNLSKVCFALTCRTLYNQYFNKGITPNCRWSKADLFLLLEKVIPDYYFCRDCFKLHLWDQPPLCLKKSWKGDNLGLHADDEITAGEIPVTQDCSITFHCLRAIMNRHFYGPLHGPPLEAVTMDTVETFPEINASVTTSIRPRIVDDKLFLSTTCTIQHREENDENLITLISETQWLLCRHLSIGDSGYVFDGWERHIEFSPHRIPELKPRCWSPKNRASQPGVVRSCSQCMTDYQVNINRRCNGPKEEGWSIEVVTWRQLGNGRDPLDDDGLWFCMAYKGYNGDSRKRLPVPESLPGIVRHRWSKGDGVLLDIDGKFVKGLGTLPKGLTVDREGEVVGEKLDAWNNLQDSD
ncbi:hypothetical protein AK830_g9034 [Neonectria ditissima]|uniref:F-box domain-containing protein n=1 Tax=Neonectria ditissima TaxID=78410 RepID=A0A0P7B9V7_9HYPO|nr:hypothetical protein AK830_g9034 [Neonectria ditissima]